MNFYIETERLILRDLLDTDVQDYFEMDSNPEVHKYLGNNPIKTMEQAIENISSIRQQYSDNGIGRWAAIEKSSGNFIGWSGLKYMTDDWNNHINFYDVGYRLMPKYWNKGYATESTKAALEFGFNVMSLTEIIGTANEKNKASRRALEKCGLQFIKQFMWKDIPCDWLKITKKEWEDKLLV
jgi:ribosomal-protein-alanine N-acetyltransferase